MDRFGLLLGLLGFSTALSAAAGTGRITGRVVDAQQHIPLEYASVLLYRLPDSTQVTGAATDARGRFQLTGLRPGRYFLTVDFLGYRKRTLGPVHLSPDTFSVDLGTIPLEATVLTTEPVEVTAQAPPVTFKIDRKVVHVSRQATAASGTALEVLETVPSITVDLEGKVQLRGSSNFTLLIDGRPTLMDPSDALAQLPASIIDRIEIITSPSARYDPEGEVGIINVILKKRRNPGIGGIVNLHAGHTERMGGDFVVNRRSGPINLYLSGYANQRSFPGTYTGVQQTPELERRSEGTYERRFGPYGLRGGIELRLGQNFLSLGGSWGQWSMRRAFDLIYQETRFDSTVSDTTYRTHDQWQRTSPHVSLFGSFQHDFGSRRHRLSLDLSYTRRQGREHSQSVRYDGGLLTQGQRSTEEGPSTHWRGNGFYRRPLGQQGKLELGAEVRQTQSRTLKAYALYDTSAQDFVDQPAYGYDFRFLRRHGALYGLLSGEQGPWGLQVGLRLEYTHRNLFLAGTQDTFRLNRWDLFPSLHLSRDLGAHRQVMVGYSRRIRRPRSWWLEPYPTWLDPNNVHQGNPKLRPAYTHALDLSLQTPLGPAFVTAELYVRKTHNRIERVQEPYEDGVILHTYENVGTSEAWGGDFTVDYSPLPFWSLRWTLDFHRYTLETPQTLRRSWNRSLRLRNDLTVGQRSTFQVHLRYRSPSATSQGTREGFATLDLAWKYSFRRNFSVTLQVRDALGTARWAYTSTTGTTQVSRRFQTQAPRVSVSLRYVFNNYRPKRPQRPVPEEPEGEPDFF